MMRHKWKKWLSVACLASVAMPIHAQVDPLVDSMIMYGINRDTGDLNRFVFARSASEQVATVHDAFGTPLLGIDAAGWIPGNRNILAFWTDPADGESKLVYVDIETARGTVVGVPLGKGTFTGGVVAAVPKSGWDKDNGHGNNNDGADGANPGSSTGIADGALGTGAHPGEGMDWVLFGVQNVEPEEDATIDFDVVGDAIVPAEPFAAKITVLGSSIVHPDGYDLPVTVRAKIGSQNLDPFGSFTKAITGNVNDGVNHEYVLPDVYPAGTRLDVAARSWVKTDPNNAGTRDNDFQEFLTVNGTFGGSSLMYVFRHGEPLPAINSFSSLEALPDFMRDFVDPDTYTFKLDENQAIVFVELGTTDSTSSAADFQDLVLLITLGADKAAFDYADDQDELAGPSTRLVRVDHKTGKYLQLMSLSQDYDGLAWQGGNVFYASRGQELWELNPVRQTEKKLGNMPASSMFGLEFAASTLMGFETVGDKLQPMDFASGASLGSSAMVGMYQLGTIIFIPDYLDPTGKPRSYD